MQKLGNTFPKHARARTPGRTPGVRFNSDEALLWQPVEIYCRIRPIDEAEERCIRVLDNKTLEIAPPGGSLAIRSQTQNAKAMQYTFTKVFDETADQKEVFDHTAKSLVSELLKGRNGLLFAYGNSGSGKTHTMTGDNRNGGLLPRSVDVLFNSISMYLATPKTFKSDKMNSFDVLSPVDALAETSKDPAEKVPFPPRTPSRNRQDAYESKEPRTEDLSFLSGVDSDCLYAVFVTYVEIYNNSVFDLLENQPTDSRAKAYFQTKVLREDSLRRMYVHNATQLEVRNADEALEAFKRGQKRRRVAQTTSNDESSRSHSIFTIRLVQASLSGSTAEVVDKSTMTVSQLSLVDLAGCERRNRTNTKGDRLKEAGNINNTLMTLRNCIEVLRENQLSGTNKIVPYRDSKITHIFKSYFEGEGKIKMVVCVNPRAEDFDETVLVFRFAEMAREISVPIEPKTLPPARPDPYIPGRRKQNHFQQEIDRISREEHANSDQNVVFSLGTFPPHELFQNADIQEILTNLESHLKHRIDTRSQLNSNIMLRRIAFRDRLVALDNDSHKLNFEVQTLKGQLDVEISKRRKVDTDYMNARQSNDTKTRRLAELERRLASKDQELNDKDLKLRQSQMEVERVKSKYSTKLLDEKERIQRNAERKNAEEIENLNHQLAARERYLRKLGYMASTKKFDNVGNPTKPPAASDTDLQALDMATTKREERESRRDRVENFRQRRSKSVGGEKWLDHRSPGVSVPLGTVLQPLMRKRKSVTELGSPQAVGKCDRYVLTTQDKDSGGELETRLYKGNVFPTAGGGAQVVLNDVEILKQTSPTSVKKRRVPETILPGETVDSKCKTGIVGGLSSKKSKR
ncbi:kinesin-like protein KIF23 isoform X1 [Artemia franciscana]|uniref:kinesin-like protein KIF23 isoform X1 n=1 Tax=Artemia franciscana TaxID=6661 RepID=UPI0032DBEC4B